MDCHVEGWLVDNMNDHRISLRNLYRWARELPIHYDNRCFLAQVCHIHLAHLHIYIFQKKTKYIDKYKLSSFIVKI
jgi:hypothetical protein